MRAARSSIITLKDTEVFILCGGFGKRLKRFCADSPKPMLKIGDLPFLKIIINYLAGLGFRRIILGLGYQAGMIKKYFLNSRIKNLKISFSVEKTPLGTGGALKHAKGMLQSNPFLVLNGDSFCQFNPDNFLSFHHKKKSLISIVLKKSAGSQDFGRVKLETNYRIKSFQEKSKGGKNCLINAGIYLFDQRIFGFMPVKKKFSLEYDFFPAMTKEKIFGYPTNGFFIDIGTPERLLKARGGFAKKLLGYARS